MEWEKAQKKITVWNSKLKDEELLRKVPYMESSESEVSLIYLERIEPECIGYELVTKEMLDSWGITEEELFGQAWKNVIEEGIIMEDVNLSIWRYSGFQLLEKQISANKSEDV